MDRTVRKPALTALQARVVARYASGLTPTEIAQVEYMSDRQVRRVTREIKEKLDAKNMIQAALISYGYGFISLPDEEGVVRSLSMADRLENLTGEEMHDKVGG